MRVCGPDEQTSGMFSYLSPEQRVRPDHPLRASCCADTMGPGRAKATTRASADPIRHGHLAIARSRRDVG